MQTTDPLIIAAIALAFTHFSIPITYYWYLRTRWLNSLWNIVVDPSHTPMISVIVPTYNEAGFIEGKLDNIYDQEYPRDRIEVVVVDSASTDGTPERVLEWSNRHPDIALKLVREPVRRGKAHALNEALKHVSGEIVIITDADSRLLGRDSLKKVAAYLSDPSVGAVSCVKIPEASGPEGIEASYRGFYNVLRVAESNLHSTPVFHGELAAFRRNLLEEVGGFPTDIGSDDSHTATLIALKGYRAIIARDLVCEEAIPRKGYHMWRVRRAQHLVQHFWKILRARHKVPKRFKTVLYTETYLHLFNPWILLAAAILLAASAATGSLLAILLLALGLALLLFKPYRAWIATQLYLIAAAVRNLWTRELAWEKTLK
ncbi:glycosyltransferase family 2 protein [Desulfurococcus amylolyticus]|uniref:Glycosyl transferase family 2 n=1 Tax=Desulfurococcus amylolyticus DSM 16532 TaxID=768672 RepID=I3XR43_DESAM|nr:glycosyltransferase family 2 protein [Desulfurococcus amylolyticus]AFL66417.1 glycosyl transferase family 2 [Desulfurococcus amylolyticus DSM 16532]